MKMSLYDAHDGWTSSRCDRAASLIFENDEREFFRSSGYQIKLEIGPHPGTIIVKPDPEGIRIARGSTMANGRPMLPSASFRDRRFDELLKKLGPAFGQTEVLTDALADGTILVYLPEFQERVPPRQIKRASEKKTPAKVSDSSELATLKSEYIERVNTFFSKKLTDEIAKFRTKRASELEAERLRTATAGLEKIETEYRKKQQASTNSEFLTLFKPLK